MIEHNDPRDMPLLDQITVVQAIAHLEARLTALINTAVNSLSQQLHDSILAQERRNATFADRERVETVARNAHDALNQLTANGLRITRLEQSLAELTTRLSDGQTALFRGATGYLVTAAIALGTVLLAFLLAHAAGAIGPHP